ncbi:MAG: DUF2341 domain-containing protein, partial [Planctomycetes bacterium]|nr:DUF2341 domain-containing protein [Planctomycetota bacterium]
MEKLKPMESNPLIHIPAKSGLRSRLVFCILFSVSCFLFSLLLFADTWLQTTTSDFNTAGSSTSDTQVINDSVQMAQTPGWWQTPAGWWNTNWQYSRPITVNNNSGGSLADYPVLVEPFRDSGDFVSDSFTNISPTGYWPMSEGTGTSATADASGQGNTATLVSSPGWVNGRYGYALDFNGTSQYITIANNLYSGKTYTTTMAWVYLDAYPSTNVGITHVWNGVMQIACDITSLGYLQFWINGAQRAQYGTAIGTGQWIHLAFTTDGTTAKIYMNGREVASGAFTGAISVSAQTMYSMRRSDSAAYMDGKIDELYMYDKTLTTEEIAMRYGAGLAGSWHFSEGSGQVLNDMAGNGNNGQLGSTSGADANDPSWTASGRFGSALSFNGASNYASIPYNPVFNFGTSNFGIDFWIKTTQGGMYPTIFSRTDDEWGIFLRNGNIHFFTPTKGNIAFTSQTVNDGNWHFVSIVRLGATLTMYVDAVSGYSNTTWNDDITSVTALRLGYDGANQYFNGTLDEVRVHNRALSVSEIITRYNAGAPKYRHDFTDIRFVNSAGTAEFTYWQETDTRFWVKVSPSLPTGNTIINMYYGNAAASAASNGVNTFDFFDDFSSDTIGTKWQVQTDSSTVVDAPTANVSIAGGYAKVDSVSYQVLVNKASTFVRPFIAETKVKADGFGAYNAAIQFYTKGSNSNTYSEQSYVDTNSFNLRHCEGTFTDYQGSAHNPVANTCTVRQLVLSLTDVWAKSYDTNRGYLGGYTLTNSINDNKSIGLDHYADSTSGIWTYFDWVMVRKYAAIEPTQTAPGSESALYLSNRGGGTWQYNRSVTVANNSGGTLTDYQVLLEPFRDTGDFIGDNLNNTGLLGSWPLSEGTGGTAADISGNNFTGTLVNSPTWTTGKFGNGLQFNGSTQRITTADSSSWDFGTGDFSIEGWVNYGAFSGVMRLICAGSQADGANKQWIFGNWTSPYRLNFAYYNGAGYTDLASNSITVSTGAWYHIAMVRSGTTVYFYFNGSNVGSSALGAVAINGGSSGTIIGARYSANTSDIIEYMNGYMDDIRVYNRALSAEEISTRYGSGLVGSWHFSEGTGQTASDLSIIGNNGQLGSTASADANDPVWTASGKSGQGLSFDGIDDYVDCGTNSNWVFTSSQPFSVEAWAYVPVLPSAWKGIVTKSRDSAPSYGIWISFANKWIFGGSAVNIEGGFVTTGWHHIVIVQNNTDNSRKIYVDGINSGSGAAETGNGSGNLWIGGAKSVSEYFNGIIDEVRIYNRALSASEITIRFASGTPKYRHDFADIRFANSNGTQEYSFWQETDQRFWLKIPSLSAGNNTIRMYYGNASAVSSSNINTTFMFGDDFGNTTWSTGNWLFDYPAEWAFSGGVLRTVGNPTNSGYRAYVPQSFSNLILDVKFREDVNTSGGSADKGIIARNTDANNFFAFGDEIWSDGIIEIAKGKTWTQYVSKSYAFTTGAWYDFHLVLNGTNLEYWINGTKQLNTTQADYSFGYVGAITSADGDMSIDNFRVRKYSAIEPVHAAPGSEQNPYMYSGVFTSSAKDTGGNDTAINSVSWIPAGPGAITMRIRAGNSDPAGWDASTPAWEDVSNGDISVAAKGKYLQYKATFAGDGTSSDPVLTDITVTYTVPIIPPADSVSCDKPVNTWYSTAVFTFTNDTGFGADIDRYYYAWDNTDSYAFTLGEPVWDSSTPQLLNSATSDGSWYFHYLPYSSTDTPGTAQDLGPFFYDGTAPAAAVLLLPANNGSVSTSTTAFSWQPVTDTSGVAYTLQMDYYAFFGSPLVNKTGLSSESYTFNGTAPEKLVGSTSYYWRVITTDGAGNTTNSGYIKFTTTSAIPLITNTMTGESYSSLQDAIDSANTVDGDVIRIQDVVAHDENIAITKDITLENAILSPSSGFAVTGQGASGGEVLRNCVITSGGISNLALGENLTIYDPAPSATATIQNSKLVNCLIESGTVIINSTLENCYTEATFGYFIDAAGNDFHLSTVAV